MNSILLWSLDKLLYLIMVLAIFFVDDFNHFEKSVLMLIVGVLMHLDAIKETIKNSNK